MRFTFPFPAFCMTNWRVTLPSFCTCGYHVTSGQLPRVLFPVLRLRCSSTFIWLVLVCLRFGLLFVVAYVTTSRRLRLAGYPLRSFYLCHCCRLRYARVTWYRRFTTLPRLTARHLLRLFYPFTYALRAFTLRLYAHGCSLHTLPLVSRLRSFGCCGCFVMPFIHLPALLCVTAFPYVYRLITFCVTCVAITFARVSCSWLRLRSHPHHPLFTFFA